jgi:hypothetical protein
LYILTSASLTATVPMRAAGPFVTMMLGMNIFTVKPLNESNYKTLSAAAAGMYIESYDTHRVPDHKQQCCNLYKKPFHSNPQIYEFAS